MAIWSGLAKALSGGDFQPQFNPLEGVLQVRAYREAMFCAHAAYMLERYLDRWALLHLPRLDPPEKEDSADLPLVVLVDDRPSLLLRFTVLNALLMGRLQMGVCVYTTQKKVREMRRFLAGLEPWVQIRQLKDRRQSLGREGYNKTLKTADFWTCVPARKILIVQQDSLQICPIDSFWFDYDYVGAPWAPGRHLSSSFPVFSPDCLVESAEHWETVVCSPGLDKGSPLVGNGGLSIRSRDCMRAICEAEAGLSPDDEPEDLFFVSHLARYAKHVPTLEQARQFSCETVYTFSIGAHASHLYLEAQEQALIYERHLKNVMALTKAWATR